MGDIKGKEQCDERNSSTFWREVAFSRSPFSFNRKKLAWFSNNIFDEWISTIMLMMH